MLTRMDGKTSRRAFLGMAAAGLAGAAVAACDSGPSAAGGQGAASTATRPWRRPVPENSLPGDAHWAIRHQGSEHAIEGYAGKASVLPGESFPLFVSSKSAGFRVTAFRLGWYQGTGARKVWSSRTIRGGAQRRSALTGSTNTVTTNWDPVIEVPTHDWPAGAYLLRLDADSGAQRYVPVTVRSASTAGKVVLKTCVQTWQAYNTWGGYDLYKGPSGAYSSRSYAVSLDRPYDENGASMFLTYERNIIKLAEQMGLNLAYLGANALFRRTRLEKTALGADRLVVCYKTAYTQDPMYHKDRTEVTSD